MSVFTEGTPTTEEDQNPATALTQEDWVTKVAAEKGEQWKDPQALAKGYLHAQERIKELEGLTKEVDKQDFAKQLLEQLQANKTPEPVPGAAATSNKDGSDTQDNTSLSPDDIQRLLDEKLSEREVQSKANANVAKVDAELVNRFGTEAGKTVQAKARELGLSLGKMQDIASESPDAFLRLIGEAPSKDNNSVAKGAVNTESFSTSNSGERDATYYAKLRRENRKLYMDPKTQKQMLTDRQRLGDKYYS